MVGKMLMPSRTSNRNNNVTLVLRLRSRLGLYYTPVLFKPFPVAEPLHWLYLIILRNLNVQNSTNDSILKEPSIKLVEPQGYTEPLLKNIALYQCFSTFLCSRHTKLEKKIGGTPNCDKQTLMMKLVLFLYTI